MIFQWFITNSVFYEHCKLSSITVLEISCENENLKETEFSSFWLNSFPESKNTSLRTLIAEMFVSTPKAFWNINDIFHFIETCSRQFSIFHDTSFVFRKIVFSKNCHSSVTVFPDSRFLSRFSWKKCYSYSCTPSSQWTSEQHDSVSPLRFRYIYLLDSYSVSNGTFNFTVEKTENSWSSIQWLSLFFVTKKGLWREKKDGIVKKIFQTIPMLFFYIA